MTDEPARTVSAPRRFVFTTTTADAQALEAILKPADRGWRSLLGYAFALPPLIIVSWLTQQAEWPVWFAAFGLTGLAAWQLARFVLAAERARAAQRHPVGAGEIEFSGGRLQGVVGGVAIDIPADADVRVETGGDHIHLLPPGRPALILPVSAFAGRTDMAAFAAVFTNGGRRDQDVSGSG